jgi:hypothetical protein
VEGVTVEDEWTNLETVLKTATEECIGKVKRDIRNGLFDQECEQVTVEKIGERIHKRKTIIMKNRCLQKCDAKNDSKK